MKQGEKEDGRCAEVQIKYKRGHVSHSLGAGSHWKAKGHKWVIDAGMWWRRGVMPKRTRGRVGPSLDAGIRCNVTGWVIVAVMRAEMIAGA